MDSFKLYAIAMTIIAAGLIYCLVGFELYNHDVAFSSKPMAVVAEGTDGAFCTLGGLTYGFSFGKVAYYNKSGYAVVNGDSTTHFRDAVSVDSTFSWHITSQEKLFALGWVKIYRFEIHLPNTDLPKNIWGRPLAWVAYKDGRAVTITPLGY